MVTNKGFLKVPVQVGQVTPASVIDLISRAVTTGTAVTSTLNLTLPALIQRYPDIIVTLEQKLGAAPFPPVPYGYINILTKDNIRVIAHPGKTTKTELIRAAVRSMVPGFVVGFVLATLVFVIPGVIKRK